MKLSNNQGLRGLAGIAGIDLGSNNNSNNIPTNLYPNIINSPEFKIEILDTKIIIGENEISYRELSFNEKIIIQSKKNITFSN